MFWDEAYGGAIRHLTDLGYSASAIKKNLTFPAPMEVISELMYRRLLETKEIILILPETPETLYQTEYVQDVNDVGRKSFRKVETPIGTVDPTDYVACDWGRMKYKDAQAFEEFLQKLDVEDAEYIRGISWPLQTIYHKRNERIERIMQNYEK